MLISVLYIFVLQNVRVQLRRFIHKFLKCVLYRRADGTEYHTIKCEITLLVVSLLVVSYFISHSDCAGRGNLMCFSLLAVIADGQLGSTSPAHAVRLEEASIDIPW